MAATVWKIKRKKDVQGFEKPVYSEIGITIITGVGKDGRPYLQYIDERMPQEAEPLWGDPIVPRAQRQTQSVQGAPHNAPADDPGPQEYDRGSTSGYGGYGSAGGPDDDLPF